MNDPDPELEGLGDVRRHVWLLVIGAVLLIGVGVTVWRARSAPVVSPNEHARSELVKLGVDPSASLHYEHALYFVSESQAIIAVERLRDDFDVEGPRRDDGKDTDLDWLVTARQTAALDLEGIDAVTRSLESLAVGLGGEYEGWNVVLQPGDVPPPVTAADA